MGRAVDDPLPKAISMVEKLEKVCTLGASVPTGLEVGAAGECAEVLGRPPVHYRGRLSFTLNAFEELIKVSKCPRFVL